MKIALRLGLRMPNNARIPYWVPLFEVTALTQTIANYLESPESHDKEIAMNINHELGVAKKRFAHSSIPAQALKTALNVPNESLPIYLSLEEVEFLKKVELTDGIKGSLDE